MKSKEWAFYPIEPPGFSFNLHNPEISRVSQNALSVLLLLGH